MPYIADATNVLTPADGDYIVNGPAEFRAIKALLASITAKVSPVSFSQVITSSANFTLTAAQSGAIVKPLGFAVATLPATAPGLLFTIQASGSAAYFNPTGNVYYPDGSSVPSGTTVTVPANATLDLYCDGGAWYVSGMAGDIIVSSPTFTANRAARSDQVFGCQLQTYTDVTASRVSGTAYFNSTNKAIVAYVTTNSGINYDAHITATINGVTFNIGEDSNSSGGCVACGSLIVPCNTFYTLTAGGTGVSGFNKWVELR